MFILFKFSDFTNTWEITNILRYYRYSENDKYKRNTRAKRIVLTTKLLLSIVQLKKSLNRVYISRYFH